MITGESSTNKISFPDTTTSTVIYNNTKPSATDGNYTTIWTATEDCYLAITLTVGTVSSYGPGVKIGEVVVVGLSTQVLGHTMAYVPIKKGQMLSVRNTNGNNTYHIVKVPLTE